MSDVSGDVDVDLEVEAKGTRQNVFSKYILVSVALWWISLPSQVKI